MPTAFHPADFLADQPVAFVSNYNKHVRIGQMMNTEDIKGAAVFLASDASAYLTGINFLVDGGWTSM